MTTLAAGLLAGKSVLAVHTLAILQAQDSINSGNSKLLMFFVGLAAFALFVQAIVMAALAIGGAKAQKKIMADIAELKEKAMPFIAQSHLLVNELGPQVKEITNKTNLLITDMTPHVKDITVKVQALVADLSPEIVGITQKVHSIAGHAESVTAMAKDKVLAFGPTVDAANETALAANTTVRETILDASEKTRAQVGRVNELVTSVIDSTVKIVRAVEHGITQPAREVSGFVNGAKVTVEHLVKHYGGGLNLSSLASLVGFGKRKTAPSPYAATPRSTAPTPVTSYPPDGMGTTPSQLPSAFGSTRRDLDL